MTPQSSDYNNVNRQESKGHHSGHAQIAEIRIANRIRELRQDKGLTLMQLAQAAGMSQAFLSRIENHKVSLTIAGLERLSQVLNVPMATFFEEDDRAVPITVCRREERPRAKVRGAQGFTVEFLAAHKTGKLMEPLVVDISSARSPMPLKSHPGEEFDYVLEGECLLYYGKDVIHLYEGDAVYYDASIPHAARPVKGRPCRLLAVVSSRDYLFHGDLTKLLNEEVYENRG